MFLRILLVFSLSFQWIQGQTQSSTKGLNVTLNSPTAAVEKSNMIEIGKSWSNLLIASPIDPIKAGQDVQKTIDSIVPQPSSNTSPIPPSPTIEPLPTVPPVVEAPPEVPPIAPPPHPNPEIPPPETNPEVLPPPPPA